MKPIFAAFVLACLGGTLHAAEKIEGAFGLKLGAVFEPTTPPTTAVNRPGAYEFKPDKPNGAFSSYFVWITPDSHCIYQIIAVGACADFEERKQTKEKLVAVLSSKYSDEPVTYESFGQPPMIVDLHDFTQLGSLPFGYFIQYLDTDAAQQNAIEEKASEKARVAKRQQELTRTADATGL